MSLIWAIGFNENDTSNVRDYSESNKDATTVANLTLAADAAEPGGRYGIGDGSSTDVEVTAGGGISYGDDFAVFTQFNVQVDQDGYIYYRPDHSRIRYDAATNAIIAQVWDNAGGTWLTSQTTKAVSLNTWYKTCLTYSDANGNNLYLDTAVGPDTDASAVNTLDTGAVTLFNDSTAGNFFDGWIRELDIYDAELTQSEVHNLMAHSQGVTLDMNGHNLNVGDLIKTFNIAETEACVFLSFTDLVRVRLISGKLAGGERWSRVGHRWDTARQHIWINKGNASPPQQIFADGISKFSGLTDDSKMVVAISKDGLRRKGNPTFLTSNTTINKQDRWVMCNSDGGAFTVNLPASPDDWEEHNIKDANGTANAGGKLITISGNGNNIDGAANGTIQNSYSSKTIVYNGTEWSIVQMQ